MSSGPRGITVVRLVRPRCNSKDDLLRIRSIQLAHLLVRLIEPFLKGSLADTVHVGSHGLDRIDLSEGRAVCPSCRHQPSICSTFLLRRQTLECGLTKLCTVHEDRR